VLRLRDAKAGSRDVPLSPLAVNLLRALQRGSTSERLIPLSYEALKAAWKRVCVRADVEGLNLHDLRHTAATRFALEFSGNKFVLKTITGHKSDSQLERYVNVKADDVVDLMHGRVRPDRGAAGLVDSAPALLHLHPQPTHNVVHATFGRRSS
jgi:integrase